MVIIVDLEKKIIKELLDSDYESLTSTDISKKLNENEKKVKDELDYYKNKNLIEFTETNDSYVISKIYKKELKFYLERLEKK
jgi:hypothetical protein